MAGKTRGAKKKTSASFPEGWQETIKQIGAEGKTKHHIEKFLGISQHTLERIVREEPIVAEAIRQYELESSIFWTDLARDFAKGENITALANANVLKYNIKNRPYIGFTDVQEVQQTTTVNAEQSAVDIFAKVMGGIKVDSEDSED